MQVLCIRFSRDIRDFLKNSDSIGTLRKNLHFRIFLKSVSSLYSVKIRVNDRKSTGVHPRNQKNIPIQFERKRVFRSGPIPLGR